MLITAPEAGGIERARGFLGLGEAPAATDASYCQFQTGLIDARTLYRDFAKVDSETFFNAPAPDPFVYCD